MTRTRALDLMPATITARIAGSSDRESFEVDVARYVVMSDRGLFAATETCLRNLPRLLDESTGGDARLQVVLVPELWERLVPGTALEIFPVFA